MNRVPPFIRASRSDEIAQLNQRILLLERQLEEAHTALEPFASFDCEDFPDDMRLFDDVPRPTMGDMRRARTAQQPATETNRER